MTRIFAALAVAAAVAAAPAAAASFDAFSSFNGVNGNGNFSYGYTGGTALVSFDTSATSGCALNGPTNCLYSAAVGNLPQASVGGSYPTVVVPTDAILVHPGNSDTLSVYTLFTAPLASTYTYTIDLESVGIDTTNGIGYTPFTTIGGVVTLGTRTLLGGYQSTATLTGSQQLTSGEGFGVIIDRNGNYGGDSTGVNFAIGYVPEPATWGLMIGGFVMVGFAARRRRTTVAA